MAQTGPSPDAAAAKQQVLALPLRTKLSLMMFLQYAVWGAWFSVIGKYMVQLGFDAIEITRVYATLSVASIISPLVFGQIADRYLPTQYLLAMLHLAGAGALFVATRYTEFGNFYFWILAYMLLYVPTISLANSLSFHHVPDASKHFPGIRVFGTIGWIVTGLIVGFTLNEQSTEPILLAAGLSVVLGLYCLVLPHTPPTGKPGDTWPPVRALAMLRDGQFATFVTISFFMAILLSGYFAFTAIYLGAAPRNVERVAAWMTLGQCSEMILLPLVPFFLKYLGMKRTLLLGIAAWGIRYGIFSLGEPAGLILGSLVLHGICYDFFFVAAYIHTDGQAPKDIRASAQALINFIIMGLGMLVGNELFGKLGQYCTHDGVMDWQSFWRYPAIAVVIPLGLLLIGFQDKKKTTAAPE